MLVLGMSALTADIVSFLAKVYEHVARVVTGHYVGSLQGTLVIY